MPPLSVILRWLDAHGAYLLVLAPAIVAAWKAMPAATRARLEAVSPRLTGLVRAVATIAPDVIGFVRVVFYQVAQGQPRASVSPAVPPQPTVTQTVRDVERGGSGLRGFALIDALVVAGCVAVCAFSAAMLAGCPAWVRPACGAPGAYSCAGDQPHVCSPSGALTPVGDLPCSRVGGQCAMSDAGVAHCAPVDGGAQ